MRRKAQPKLAARRWFHMSFIPQGNRGDDSLTLRRNHHNVILVRACKAGVILQIIGNATACLPGQLPGPRNRTQQSNSHRTLYGIERIVPDQRGIAVLIHSYKIRVQFDR